MCSSQSPLGLSCPQTPARSVVEALDIHTHAVKQLQGLRNNKHGAGSLLCLSSQPSESPGGETAVRVEGSAHLRRFCFACGGVRAGR